MRGVAARCTSLQVPLNESPSEKEGKSAGKEFSAEAPSDPQ